ncbi:c-type cytochrome [Ralstonia syzygii]|uniref:Putative cytochrome c n=1 Tax=Ralstonia syzygii R24 TaxID=907261 RepID=G3A276_9RALS|nr:cytochrome c [Ralstonia syzygii]CCA85508.1 putative cytochrome c [Ralstonia syzygii R24]
MKAWFARLVGWLGCTAVLLAAVPCLADTAALTITAGTQQRTWTRDELLHDRRLTSVTVEDDNLKRRLTFQAIPVSALMRGFPVTPDASATTAASDGYVAHLPLRMLLADRVEGPRAWLAVENPAAPWPTLKGQDIGPFRLVWTVPPSSQEAAVNESLWTYSIVRIDVAAPPSERFAALRPAPGLPADGPVMRGFATFQRVCFSCHSLNRVGDATLGPDLNVPYSAVEYLGDERLAKLIRDPQSLRWWPNARMSAINEKTLTDAQLKDLLAYLHHMAVRKAGPSAKGA